MTDVWKIRVFTQEINMVQNQPKAKQEPQLYHNQ